MSPPQAPELPFAVSLSADHPGLDDLDYRRRRDAIAALARAYVPGTTPAAVEYTDEEQATWRKIWSHLKPAHEMHASAEVLDSIGKWAPWTLPIPQLHELSEPGGPLEGTGIRFEPVPGLVPSVEFFAGLGRDVFLSTQYMRHPSRPLYTPEPDLVHEFVGHAGTFSIPGVAEVSGAFGRAARGASGAKLKRLERLYWFTIEFGLVLEGGKPKAFGAGLLSSAGELARLDRVDVRPFSIAEIEATPYGTDDVQPVLFVAPSCEHLLTETLAALLDG